MLPTNKYVCFLKHDGSYEYVMNDYGNRTADVSKALIFDAIDIGRWGSYFTWLSTNVFNHNQIMLSSRNGGLYELLHG